APLDSDRPIGRGRRWWATPNQRLKLTGVAILVFRASVPLLAAPAAWPRRSGRHSGGGMSETDQPLAVVRQVFAAADAHDLDAFRALLHPEVVMQVGGSPVSLTGPEAVVAAVAVTLRAIPDVRVTV